ncbi:2-dehydropantoate 2-reductase [Xylona heveae TC161]|uniref:2-dehydropantoate 2-reductase n=1 Tax=Xylona heveae (strain CBS 132557 / TC161) TaxID=1328760 RepID=A0A161TQW3_XYLHT|nr:2-dehydropantoate 2-reductase [Xylona heveae TC161]KZF24776.1 2-dehydropantoate 2-reductase [Xylona heveae TC161]
MEHQVQSRIHVLGLGSIGTFAAHALAEIPDHPPVTLLLHRESLVDAYFQNGSQIALKTSDGDTVRHGGYDLEVLRDGEWYHATTSAAAGSMATEPIQHLIISVKATQTVSALEPLRSRLTPASTILFLQNGCGMIDEVNTYLFPDASARPNYITGVISHGICFNRPFDITHTGFSATSLGMVPDQNKAIDDPSRSRPLLLRSLPLVSRLNATAYAYHDVLQIQLEKLAVNAFCNPLCALHDAKNGFLFTLPEMRRRILTEISHVACALPELKDVPGVAERFAFTRLENTVNAILEKTKESTCSMVWDLRAGRETEVLFINGYWSRRGRETGVPTPVNDTLVRQILERQAQQQL